MDMRQNDRTFEDIIREACSLHSKEVSELKLRVEEWKERFELILSQKNSYREEVKKLKFENDFLRKDLKTLQDLINRIGPSYLTPNKPTDTTQSKQVKNRPSTGKKQSPDSTCNSELQRDETSPNNKVHSQNNCGNHRLSKRNKKRKNRYTEDPSPEQKRLKKGHFDQKSSESSTNNSRKKSDKSKVVEKSVIFVPETLEFNQEFDEEEGVVCERNVSEPADCVIDNVNSNGECKTTVPETVAMETYDTTDSSEIDCQNTVVEEKKFYSLQAMLESPPSQGGNSDGEEVNGEVFVSHRLLNLSSNSVKVDTESSEDEVCTVKENTQNDRMRKNENKDSPSKNDEISDETYLGSQDARDTVKQSFRSKSSRKSLKLSNSSGGSSNVCISGPKPQIKSSFKNDDFLPLSPVFAAASSARKISIVENDRSPSVFDNQSENSKINKTRVENLHSKYDSDPESPLLLKFGTTGSQELNKSENVKVGHLVRGHTFPPTGRRNVDLNLTLEKNDKDDVEVHVNTSCSEEEISCYLQSDKRQTRNSQSKMSRSPALTSKKLERNSRSLSSVDSPSKSEKLKRLKEKGNVMPLDVAGMGEGRILRQTTLSQVFRNSPQKSNKRIQGIRKTKSQEDQDIQKAIELSLSENHVVQNICGDNCPDEPKEKENTPPFKKPATPKKSKTVTPKTKSPRRNSDRRCKSYMIDLDETVSPSSLNPFGIVKTRKQHEGQGHINSPPSPQGVMLNGSIDPAIELSQLCEDSEFVTEQENNDKHGFEKLKGSHFDHSNDHSTVFVSPKSDIAALHDFTLKDLHNVETGKVLTSTCIEEDSQSIPSSSRSVKFGPGIKRKVHLFQSFSEDVENDRHTENVDDNIDEIIIESNGNETIQSSFDRVPRKNEPQFAYVEVVRKQDERHKLKAHFCKECHEYYKGMNLTEKEIQERMQACSKHRANYSAPDTPEHFWSIHFLNTPDLEEKGYAHKEEKTKPSTHRRRFGLRKIFKSKTEEEKEKKMESQQDQNISDIEI